MKKNCLLSIIIPVYNSKKFIIKCLKSIISQFEYRIQIIIIDDASTDGSLSLIKEFFKKNKTLHHIKILRHKKNLGPGPARNTGLKHSYGKYIGFVDSDDLLLNNFSTNIFNLISKNKYDIIEFGFFRFNKNKKERFNYFYSFEKGQLIKKIKPELFAKTTMYPSLRVYKKSLWKNIYFPNYYYEDYATIYKLFNTAKNAYFINKALLAYRYNSNSITSKITKKNYNDMFKTFNSIKLKKNDFSQIILKIRIARSICYFKHLLSIQDKNYDKMINLVKSYNLSWKYVIKLKIYDFLFFKLNRFYQSIDKFRFKIVKLL